MLKVCIVGNPNSGKSTFFNLLTASHSQVGNWAGVTVEAHKKHVMLQGRQIEFIDLPGSYGIRNNTSKDEKEVYDFLLHQHYDIIINIIDITSIEKSLSLTLQLLELGKPLIIALNKIDLVDNIELQIVDKLSIALNHTIFCISSIKQDGIEQIKEFISYDHPFHSHDHQISLLSLYPKSIQKAFQSIIHSSSIFHFLENVKTSQDAQYIEIRDQLQNEYNYSIELSLIEMRYSIISDICKDINNISSINIIKNNNIDLIDKFLLNKFISVPLFLGIIYIIFTISLNIGEFFKGPFEDSADYLFIQIPTQCFSYFGLDHSFLFVIIYGIAAGVKTVAAFIPLIATLYTLLSILEESGYLARSAFIMNRLFKMTGFSGVSFVPLIMGFGCNVPAIMSTRVIKNKINRLAIIITLPFMMCGARLSVFLILSSVFFAHNTSIYIFLLYIIGIIIGMISILIISKLSNYNKNTCTDFLIEMPSYQIPSLKIVIRKTCFRTKEFVLGAGKLIVIVCFIMQILNSFSINGSYSGKANDSILITIGKSITPIFEPIGLNEENWPAAVSLVTGLLAKEVIIGTLNSLYLGSNHSESQSLELFSFSSDEIDDSIANHMQALFPNELSVFCYMLFIMLYFPCISVFAAIKRELSLSWAVVSGIWSTSIAYLLSALIYQLFTYIMYDKMIISALFISFIIVMLTAYTIVYLTNKELKNESI